MNAVWAARSHIRRPKQSSKSWGRRNSSNGGKSNKDNKKRKVSHFDSESKDNEAEDDGKESLVQQTPNGNESKQEVDQDEQDQDRPGSQPFMVQFYKMQLDMLAKSISSSSGSARSFTCGLWAQQPHHPVVWKYHNLCALRNPKSLDRVFKKKELINEFFPLVHLFPYGKTKAQMISALFDWLSNCTCCGDISAPPEPTVMRKPFVYIPVHPLLQRQTTEALDFIHANYVSSLLPD